MKRLLYMFPLGHVIHQFGFIIARLMTTLYPTLFGPFIWFSAQNESVFNILHHLSLY